MMLGDGSVRFVSENVAYEVVYNLTGRDDGAVVGEY